MDDVITAFEDRRCEWDKDVTFTKRGLIDYIEQMFKDNDPLDKKAGWDLKAN